MRIKSTLLAFCIASALFGQENLTPLQAPTSPAASVLGMQPNAVLTPKSYDALETALYSNILDNQGGPAIPSDFALEFSPYWAKDRRLSLEEYLFPKKFSDKLIRNSSFSVASTKNFNLGDSTPSHGIAFGYRCSFFIGSKNDADTISFYRKQLYQNQTIKALIGGKIESEVFVENAEDFLKATKPIVLKALIESGKYLNASDAKIKTEEIFAAANSVLAQLDFAKEDEFKDAFYLLLDEYLQAETMFNAFKSYVRERQGLRIDLAYANFLNFPTNNFSYSAVPKQTFWITPSYRLKGKLNFVKAMGVLRYEWYNRDYYRVYFPQSAIYQNNIDYGVAISAVAKRFSFNFEIVGRSSNSEEIAGFDDNGNQLYRKIKKTDTQYMGTFNFNLTDQIVISYSLGNRFEPIANPLNTLVSLISLNFGFGAPSAKDVF